MSEDFARKIQTSGLLKDIGELPMGRIIETDRMNILIPICCREGWASCPHVPKKIKLAKRNIGL